MKTVKEFIEELQKFDPELPITVQDSEYGLDWPVAEEYELPWHDLKFPKGTKIVRIL